MKKLVKTKFKNMVFWYQWDDKYIGQRIALGKYEPYLTKLILEKITPEKVMVDVGANIGYYSLLAGKTAKKVYAIEPEELNFSILKKNTQSNGLKNIELIKVAVGRRQGKVTIKRSKINPGAHKVAVGRGEIKMIKFLKRVYGSIYWIDEYGQTYRKIKDGELDRVAGNLMVKKGQGWEWGQVKDIKIKKWAKRCLKKYPLT